MVNQLPYLTGGIVAGTLFTTLSTALGVLASMGTTGTSGSTTTAATTTVSKFASTITAAVVTVTTAITSTTTTTTTTSTTTTTTSTTTSTTPSTVTSPPSTTHPWFYYSTKPATTEASPYGPLSEAAVIGLSVTAAVLFVAGVIALIVWLVYRGLKKLREERSGKINENSNETSSETV